jgi:hypothetical protein
MSGKSAKMNTEVEAYGQAPSAGVKSKSASACAEMFGPLI